jgi:mRNA-degrading endonuclease RelE of RelBE toxin-antitoxin system
VFQIDFSLEALDDLQSFRAFEQREILEAIDIQLTYQPTNQTRNRKPLRPNNLAQWELRLDRLRIFYIVDTNVSVVQIVAIGYKLGNKLFIRGEEYEL